MPAVNSTPNNLGATVTFGAVSLGEAPQDVAIGIYIDNGAGAAPTDTPVGSFTLQTSWDASRWFDYPDASSALAAVSPTGNAVLSKAAVVRSVCAKYARVVYTRSSGGGTNSACTVYVDVK